jgi:hypothetical protein
MVMARGKEGGGREEGGGEGGRGEEGERGGRERGINTNLMYADVALITEYHLIRLLGLRLQQFTFFIQKKER